MATVAVAMTTATCSGSVNFRAAKLYISYIGRSIQDNSERFPSVLVQELIDYIGQSHYLPGDEALNCDESEARVKAHLTCLHTRMPFDPQNYQPCERQSYAREWSPAASRW